MVDWDKIKEAHRKKEEEEFGPQSERNTRGLGKMFLHVLIFFGILLLLGWWGMFR